ncbi:unnamed protein product [Trichobilharzia regenti]|nr:unnamed protein product [Trichobilharzia regenti]
MDAEDLGFLCEAYQILLNKCRSPSDTVSYPDSERNNFPMNTAVTDPHVATLVNLSHWIEHPPTLIPDPITVKSYINDNGRLVTSHHLSSRRQKSVRQRHHNKGSRSKHSVSKQSSVRQRSYARSSDSNDVYSSLSDQSVDHSPGEHNVNDLANRPICKNEGCQRSARTQGYYKMPAEERFRRPWCVGRSLIGEDGRRRPIPLMPATVQAQLGGDAALQAFGENIEERLTEQASEAKKKQLTQFREARSVQRRLLAEFQDIETGDLLKFNQLKVTPIFVFYFFVYIIPTYAFRQITYWLFCKVRCRFL